MNRDEEHVRLLSIFHYILAALMALVAMVPVIHLLMGFFLIFGAHHFPVKPGETPPPAFVGWIVVAFAGIFITAGLTLATLVFFAGRNLARKRHHQFCFVIACLICLFVPLGTVLGVFTIITLNRDSVKQLFG